MLDLENLSVVVEGNIPEVVKQYAEILAREGIAITRVCADSIYSICGVFYISEDENGVHGFHPNALLDPQISSSITLVFMRIAASLGFAEKVNTMVMVFPADPTYTKFEVEPMKVQALLENYYKTKYGSVASDIVAVDGSPIMRR